jgi:ATP-binding cassette, subfamily B, bacterial
MIASSIAAPQESPSAANQGLEFCYQGEKPWKTLAAVYRRHTGQLLLAVFYFVIKQSPVWAMPLITANIIDIISSPHPNAGRDILINAAVLVVLLAQNVPVHCLYVNRMSSAVRSVEADLRAAIVRRLQQLSISFYKNSSTGVLQAKVLRDVEAVDQMSRQLFDGGLTAISMIVAAIAVTAYRAPQFLPFFVITILVACVLRLSLKGALKKRNRDFRTEIERMSSDIISMIHMIPITRAHAVEETEIDKVNQKLGTVKSAGLRLDSQIALFQSSAWASFNFFNMACLILAAWLAYKKIFPLTAGDVVMLTTYFGGITQSVLMLANMLPNISKGFESVRSIGEVLECPDLEKNIGKTAIREVHGEFHFENVTFVHPGASRGSIRDFNLHVKSGETVGIVGPSGAGKSTLMSLVLGFDRPGSGKILLDGRDMNEIDLRSYRRFVGVVAQDTLLFQGTIRENVLYGTRNLGKSHVLDALRDANAMEFIEKLPDGINTTIGEHGARLSGGQKQRIAIARALIRNPRVLILDEATSALDAASEKLVQEALNRLMKGRTTFIVAHRLSTIRNVDRVVVLDEGRIVESGGHDELLGRAGLYAELWEMQSPLNH